MTIQDQLLALIERGAVLTINPEVIKGLPPFAVGAAAIKNGVLIWAAMFAEDQHHVHTIAPFELKLISETVIEIWSRNQLHSVLEAMDRDDAAKYNLANWIEFKHSPGFATWDAFFQRNCEHFKLTLFEKR